MLHPGTKQPVGPEDLAPIFPMGLIMQEVSHGALDRHPRRRCWTSTASGGRRRWCARRRLEKALDTPAHIYYKYEGVSPAGSHKPNTAVPQAYYNKAEGVQAPRHRDRRGPVGQRAGVRLQLFGLECKVYMVQVSYDQKPYRRMLMMHVGRRGASPSPSDETDAGRAILAQDPDSPGSLGIAISEAVEDAATRDGHRTTRSAAC